MARFQRFGFDLNPRTFFVSSFLIVSFLLCGFLYPQKMKAAFQQVQDFVATQLGWSYFLTVGFFLVFCIYLAFSRYAHIRLGKDNEKPQFSTLSWFAMLFSAGMGIGLLFYSVAEPLIHFSKPPTGEGLTPEAARNAMRFTYFHWGLHAWAIYIVMGLSLSYFSYRRGLPLTIRTIFYPLIKEKIHGPWGDLVDIFSVFGTLFGIATSLGLGVMQVNAGLSHLGLLDFSLTNQVLLICAITAVATASVVSGLSRGILWLSKINLVIGVGLLLFVFAFGPTVFLIKSFVQNTGDYFQNLVEQTFFNGVYTDSKWQKSWTIFYWAWWISWAPFVGMFIARVSRGRTIREFILTVLIAPSLFTFIWLSVFGNSGIYFSLFENDSTIRVAATATETMPTALFLLLEKLPLSDITAFIAIVVISTYFVTSSDSGSLVIDIITAGGNEDPPVQQRIFWALTEGAVAAGLLVTGGLLALQTAALLTALPLSIILVMTCVGLYRALQEDHQQGP